MVQQQAQVPMQSMVLVCLRSSLHHLWGCRLMPILAGGDGWGVVVATSFSGHTQLMVSGKGNLAVTIALSVDRLHLLVSLVALPKC